MEFNKTSLFLHKEIKIKKIFNIDETSCSPIPIKSPNVLSRTVEKIQINSISSTKFTDIQRLWFYWQKGQYSPWHDAPEDNDGEADENEQIADKKI